MINIQSEDDFKKTVLQNELPVVLDFHARYDVFVRSRGKSMSTSRWTVRHVVDQSLVTMCNRGWPLMFSNNRLFS